MMINLAMGWAKRFPVKGPPSPRVTLLDFEYPESRQNSEDFLTVLTKKDQFGDT